MKNNFALRTLCLGSAFLLLWSPVLAYPVISGKAGGIGIQNNDIISKTPAFEFFVVTAKPLDTGSVSLVIDRVNTAGFTTTKNSDTDYTISYTVPTGAPLSDGIHCLTVEARDTGGSKGTFEASGLTVKSSDSPQLNGAPLNYPNPFDPSIGTTVSYYLTKDADITLNIYDISGTLVAKRSAPSASAGGKAGYNETPWDGKSGTGDFVGNGMYLLFVVADGKVIGKGKMAALRR
jgi:hypothetical protein